MQVVQGPLLYTLVLLAGTVAWFSAAGGAAAGAARPEATDELGTEAKTLRGEARAGTLSSGLFAAIVATLGEYKPWEKDAQKTLLDKLRGRHTAEGQAALAEPPEARPRLTHPLRALPLAAGLAANRGALRVCVPSSSV